MATESLASQRALKAAQTRRENRKAHEEMAGDYPVWVYDKETGEIDKLTLRERVICNIFRKLPEDLKPRYSAAFKLKGKEMMTELQSVMDEFKARGGAL